MGACSASTGLSSPIEPVPVSPAAAASIPSAGAILEESENLKLDRIATVRTKRGEEVLINVDQAVIALANFFSDLGNEHRGGWTLNVGWYEGEVRKLHNASVAA
jgi:hypothetical protein